MKAPRRGTSAIGLNTWKPGRRMTRTPASPTAIAARRRQPTRSPSTGPARAAMISGQVAKIAWLSISPSITKDMTVTQISATRSTPRKIWRPSVRLRATLRTPPSARGRNRDDEGREEPVADHHHGHDAVVRAEMPRDAVLAAKITVVRIISAIPSRGLLRCDAGGDVGGTGVRAQDNPSAAKSVAEVGLGPRADVADHLARGERSPSARRSASRARRSCRGGSPRRRGRRRRSRRRRAPAVAAAWTRSPPARTCAPPAPTVQAVSGISASARAIAASRSSVR